MYKVNNMSLKLAEYKKDGKFLGFLELGKEFGYYGDQIHLVGTNSCNWAWLARDKTDPLNRFTGLFDGLTYGKGRFVLEVNEEYTYVDANDVFYKMVDFIAITSRKPKTFDIINLHESPELYKKLNNYTQSLFS